MISSRYVSADQHARPCTLKIVTCHRSISLFLLLPFVFLSQSANYLCTHQCVNLRALPHYFSHTNTPCARFCPCRHWKATPDERGKWQREASRLHFLFSSPAQSLIDSSFEASRLFFSHHIYIEIDRYHATPSTIFFFLSLDTEYLSIYLPVRVFVLSSLVFFWRLPFHAWFVMASERTTSTERSRPTTNDRYQEQQRSRSNDDLLAE